MNRIELVAYIGFFIANILLVVNPGIYWDDWIIYNMSDKGIMNQYYGNGNLVFGYLHLFMKKLSGSPLLYHFLTFASQLLTLNVLFKILKIIKISHSTKLFFSFCLLIFAVFPIHDAKQTIIIFPHILCLTSFVVATYFLCRYSENKKIIFRIGSLLLFVFSFLINSLLVYYFIPLFFLLFYRDRNFFLDKREKLLGKIKIVANSALRYLDFILIPFIYWIFKSIYLKPTMQYESIGYNQVKLENLIKIPYRIIVFLYVTVTDILPVIKEAFSLYEIWILLIILTVLFYKTLNKSFFQFRSNFKLIIFGFVILMIGAFPYLLVNKYPSYLDYLSRHQLLLGIGFSIIIGSILFYGKNQTIKYALVTFSLSFCTVITVFLQFSYFKGYIKQQVFQNYFAGSEVFNSDVSKVFILEDDTENFTQKGNPTKFYAFAGMIKRMNEKENIMILREEEYEPYIKEGILEKIAPYYFQYNLTNFSFSPPKKVLKVTYGEALPQFPMFSYYSSYFTNTKFKWDEYFKFEIVDFEKNNFSAQRIIN